MRVSKSSLFSLLFALSCCIAAAAAVGDDAGYACNAIDKIPKVDQCTFVTSNCSGDSRIPYAVWYYCNIAPAGLAAKFFYVLAMVLTLPLLFCLLGDTAEVYFSPIMAHVSQSIPKMRPRFAGVTFVAMGNGAPDLSANISAIRNGEVLLSAGALTGSAMFVQCIVASEVVRIASGVTCRGATLRDVAIYLVSVVGVLAAFHSGVVSRWFVAGCILMYVVYVVWVFCGDEWHARGRPRPNMSWQMLLQAVGRGAPEEESLLTWAALDSGEDGGPNGDGDVPPASKERASSASFLHSVATRIGSSAAMQHRYHSLRLDARTYQDAVWADLGAESAPATFALSAPSFNGGGTRAGHLTTLSGGGGLGPMEVVVEDPPTSSTGGGGGESHVREVELRSSAEGLPSLLEEEQVLDGPSAPYAPHPGVHGDEYHIMRPSPFAAGGHHTPDEGGGGGGGGGDLRRWSKGSTASAGGASSALAVPAQGDNSSGGGGGGGGGDAATGLASRGVHQEERGRDGPAGGSGSGGGKGDWWWHIQHELTIGTCSEWAEYGAARRRFRAITFPLLLPVYAALRCTIPFVDPAGYSQQWLVVTMLWGPLAVLVYFGAAGEPLALGVALVCGALGAAAVHVLTRDDPDALPPFDLGTTFDFGPAFFSLLGFFMGVLWIDTLASEVVGMLSLLAALCHVPPALMGLSLLAVGNSLGDFFSNMALTRRGVSSTALTACFASPLFNMLLSLGLGFSAYFARNGVHSLEVTLPDEVAVGGFFLVIYNFALVGVGMFHGGRLPARWYLFARSWYCLYLACAFVLGIHSAAEGRR